MAPLSGIKVVEMGVMIAAPAQRWPASVPKSSKSKTPIGAMSFAITVAQGTV